MARQTGYARRKTLMRQLEEARGTRLITYITSTREGLNSSIEMDMVRPFYDHVVAEPAEALDLFVVSRGGDGVMPRRLVALIRDHVQRFSLLVPNVAQSAATIIGLGADEIVMHPMGYLGPIDPRVKNDFNPTDLLDPSTRLKISVEDVDSYTELAREFFKTTQTGDGIQVLRMLTDRVNPLALGNVRRMHAQTRQLASKLLKLHMHNASDRDIESIVESLTSKLNNHEYPLTRAEARELGLPVVDVTQEVADLMWQLWLAYEEDMKLQEPFYEERYLLDNAKSFGEGKAAVIMLEDVVLDYVESTSHSDVKLGSYEISGYRKDGYLHARKKHIGTRWVRR